MGAGKPWTEQERQEAKLAYLEEALRTAASTNPVPTSNTRTLILADSDGGPRPTRMRLSAAPGPSTPNLQNAAHPAPSSGTQAMTGMDAPRHRAGKWRLNIMYREVP